MSIADSTAAVHELGMSVQACPYCGRKVYLQKCTDDATQSFKFNVIPETSGWPTFANSGALQANAWGAYYTSVYGALPTEGYPIDTFSLWMIYDDKIHSAGVTQIPNSV